MQSTVKAEKKELRAVYQTKLAQIPEAKVRRWSAQICARALALPVLPDKQVIAAYCSFGHEVATRPLLAGLLAAGHVLVLPVVDRQSRMMEFRRVDSLDALTPGVYGILEPRSGELCSPEEIELFFIPGLAFDRQGNRLGRGGGYYDRYLSTVRPDAAKIGLAFQLQIAEALPVAPHDIKVDAVLTEQEIICYV
ncbi:5-formyltetrahydrofolate cyclo-ligase [Capillibacterium thermochitinicola]|uniref:5-formyltetrahydrofolate cyclo-ligase n=1 Tax=Capillibacterium thermochitinicola TaxID=2699427 RepID=A0A8J6I2Q5_9FIRM|nr:5-formyltetrahydrofolate cyclo-ligase [Capillibacterium thermochitinicola]MBA2133599.1 5-formyltetrahydrofolate cyclo-ligase [Capillibacterium thermochitinicola]